MNPELNAQLAKARTEDLLRPAPRTRSTLLGRLLAIRTR